MQTTWEGTFADIFAYLQNQQQWISPLLTPWNTLPSHLLLRFLRKSSSTWCDLPGISREALNRSVFHTIYLSRPRLQPLIIIPWLCVRARDRTADEDTEQIELFVITAYPNTGMPAIILPTLGMAGGKWDSSLCSAILLDFYPPPPPLFLLPAFFFLFSWRIENNFPALHSWRSRRRKKTLRIAGRGRAGRGGEGGWHADSER